MSSQWGIVLIALVHHVRSAHVYRTCGEATDVGLAITHPSIERILTNLPIGSKHSRRRIAQLD